MWWTFLMPVFHVGSILIAWPYSIIYSLFIKKTCVPSITNPLLLKSGKELAEMIRNQKITSTEVVRTVINRVKIVNPIINAVVQDRFEDAIKEAQLVDEMIKNNPDPKYWEINKPLLGLPLTVKECIAVSGMSHNAGRIVPKERIAEKDAVCVANMKSAGAIIILVSNTPELCYFWESYNSKTGLTRNPYDTQRTVGGSSGGEGALLGAGASVISLGSDGVGSGRLPAHFCGVFAHKPTARIISNDGHIPVSNDKEWNEYLVFSPLSKHAVDLPILLSVADPKASKILKLDEPVDFSKLNIFYLEEANWLLASKIDPIIKEAIKKSALHFKKYGIEPKKASIIKFEYTYIAIATIMMRLKVPHNVFQKSEDPEDFSYFDVLKELILGIFCCSNYLVYSILFIIVKFINEILPQSYENKLRTIQKDVSTHIEELLGDNGVLIMPTFYDIAPLHYQMYYKFTNVIYVTLSNFLGLPSTTCPAGLTKNGMPYSVQIVANKNQDRLTLAIARELEKLHGGWVPPQAADMKKSLW